MPVLLLLQHKYVLGCVASPSPSLCVCVLVRDHLVFVVSLSWRLQQTQTRRHLFALSIIGKLWQRFRYYSFRFFRFLADFSLSISNMFFFTSLI